MPLSDSSMALIAANVAIDVLLKGTFVVGCTYLGAVLLRSSSAAVRHALWTAAFTTLLLIPVLPSPLLSWQIDASRLLENRDRSDFIAPTDTREPALIGTPDVGSSETGIDTEVVAAPSAPRPASAELRGTSKGVLPPISPADAILAVWGMGLLVCLLRLVAGLGYAVRLGRRCLPVPLDADFRRRLEGTIVRADTRVCFSPHTRMPLNYGIFRPLILLPMEARRWPVDRVRIVLEHEMAHVERWDYAVHLVTQVVRALYWPNPLVWLALRRIRIEQEHACDDRVLARGARPFEYAEHLLHIARSCVGGQHAGVVALAQRHTLKNRVRSILNSQVDRRPLRVRAGLALTIAAIAVALPLASVQSADPAVAERTRLLSALDTADPAARIAAADYFAWNPVPAALEGLIRLANDPDSALRVAAVHALGRYTESSATYALIEALADDDPAVVAEAAAALEGHDLPAVREALRRAEARLSTPAPEPDPLDDTSLYLFLEAEEGRLSAPMAVHDDEEASGARFVYVVDQDGHDPPESGPGAVRIPFDVRTPGEYVVWGRIRSPNDGDNSFFVSVDGERDLIWDVPGPEYTDFSENWTWDAVSARDPETNRIADPIVYALDAGRHTLHVRNREDGTRLDAVMVTNDLSFVPSGAAPRRPPEAPQYVWMQAEDGRLADGMTREDDGDAAGGAFVWLPDDDGNDAPDGGPASATYEFTLEQADEYVAWARVIAPHENDNSFFVSLDAGNEVTWHTRGLDGDEISRDWTWMRVRLSESGRAGSDAWIAPLDQGLHTLRLRVREDGTRLDVLLITNDHTFHPRGAGVAPPRNSVFVWREAEDAQVDDPMSVEQHREASGGAFIEVDRASSVERPPRDGTARYRLDVSESGTYVLWGRVSIEDEGADSFWIRMNAGRWIRWNGIEEGTRWHWAELHDSDHERESVRFDLESGTHTLEIRYRESDARLDRLLLTNDATYVPTGTGAASSGAPVATSRIEVIF